MVTLDIDKETCGNIGGFNPCDVCDYKRCKNCILYELVMKFIGHKAADVAPVRRGRWVHDINNLYGCSECMERETMSPKKLKNYCPNCGARMDGDTNGN